MKRSPPERVQQWVDSLENARKKEQNTNNVALNCHHSPLKVLRGVFARDASIQSDGGSSRCSSVESMLELRKPDPEAVLIGLGFGPSNISNSLNRIPQRFLGPSKLLPHLDIEKFIEQHNSSQHEYDIQKFSCSTPASPARPRPSM